MWLLVGLSALVLMLFLLRVAPFVLAPLFSADQSSRMASPGGAGIERRSTTAQTRARVAALRELTASPQAVANAAKSLTIVGLLFNRLRDERLKSPSIAATADPLAAPFPVRLGLSQTNGDAVIALSNQAIAWSIVAPSATAPRAIFGIESHVLPELGDSPSGVLAGFRTSETTVQSIAGPLQLEMASQSEQRAFCKSVSDWSAFFSLPLSKTSYVLVEDASGLEFAGGVWTTNGRVVRALDNAGLHRLCAPFDVAAWR
ncbi:MAG: hypothetical protein WDN31_13365 [Hyphomicrobium sp.]